MFRKSVNFLTLFFLFVNSIFTNIIRIYAASDLRYALDEIKTTYQNNDKIYITYGSSGKGFQQIINGAPYDMFFSANLIYANKIYEILHMQKVNVSKPKIFAEGRIVLFLLKNHPYANEFLKKNDFKSILISKKINKIAIANEKFAPYGIAAKEFLNQLNIYNYLKNKFIIGESISHTATYVLTGSVDLGILALSIVKNKQIEEKGYIKLIPKKYHNPIRQAYVVIFKNNSLLLNDFIKHFHSLKSQQILKNYGFEIPKYQL
ncbi:MAG: molybdate ABC transporter substrate-binding protein [Leptospiraceae bacterium]|nr:MAG: molybdate ABC transporter substrate-binding protein [Leptospiraceae bacterium]